MRAYFDSPTALAALEQVANHWLGTPFAGHQCVAGAGVDCIHLAARVYVETGLLEAVPDFGRYNLDGGQHSPVDRVTEWLITSDRFMLDWSGRQPFKTPAPGDLLCLQLGRQPWHCAVMLDAGEILEVHATSRVARRPLADPTWSRRVASIWRPIIP